jgi:hypothetical protein
MARSRSASQRWRTAASRSSTATVPNDPPIQNTSTSHRTPCGGGLNAPAMTSSGRELDRTTRTAHTVATTAAASRTPSDPAAGAGHRRAVRRQASANRGWWGWPRRPAPRPPNAVLAPRRAANLLPCTCAGFPISWCGERTAGHRAAGGTAPVPDTSRGAEPRSHPSARKRRRATPGTPRSGRGRPVSGPRTVHSLPQSRRVYQPHARHTTHHSRTTALDPEANNHHGRAVSQSGAARRAEAAGRPGVRATARGSRPGSLSMTPAARWLPGPDRLRPPVHHEVQSLPRSGAAARPDDLDPGQNQGQLDHVPGGRDAAVRSGDPSR